MFCLAFVLCILSSDQVYAAPFSQDGWFESDQRNFEDLKTFSMNSNDDEFIEFDHSDDTVWFSIASATSPPVLEVDVTSLDFGETDTSKTFSITNSGGSTLVWSLYENEEWINVDATSGSLEAASETVTVEVDRSKVLTVGVFDSIITITSNGGSAEIEVTMTVVEHPVLDVSPSILNFGSGYVVKELFITNSGTGVLDWVIEAQEEWITVDQESGGTNEGKTDVVNIMSDRSAVTALGTYNGELSITSDGGDVTVSVVMERVNHVPETPIVISPVDGATDQSLYTTLSWRGSDIDTEDGDVVAYDVYFSSNESLVDVEDVSVLVCSSMEVCYCDSGTNSLERKTTYYWKVIAKDSYGEITPSRIWHFTTGDYESSLCPTLALELGYEERHLLRGLRDRVLAKDEEGRSYIELYYHYSWELLLILFLNDELRLKTAEIVEEVLSVVGCLLVDKEAFMTVETVREINELLGEIALYTGPPLKAVLKKAQADIENREKMKLFGIIIADG